MTMKHVLDGLMQVTKSKNHSHLCRLCELDVATVSRIRQGRSHAFTMPNLNRVQAATGIPFDTLFAWYRLPAEAVLGRVA